MLALNGRGGFGTVMRTRNSLSEIEAGLLDLRKMIGP